jgi:sortase A
MVPNKTLQWLLRWSERLLFACAAVLLGYWGYVQVDAWLFQNEESAALQRFVPQRAGTPAPEVGLVGRIEIPRIELSVVISEGTSDKTLRRAAGHIRGTGVPGEPGNVGIAGHRDTFFRPLRNIQNNDLITVTTFGGAYRYRVVSTKVVNPDNVDVLDPDGKEILTLVTCYPFYFVGPSPSRFIVRAERVT